MNAEVAALGNVLTKQAPGFIVLGCLGVVMLPNAEVTDLLGSRTFALLRPRAGV